MLSPKDKDYLTKIPTNIMHEKPDFGDWLELSKRLLNR